MKNHIAKYAIWAILGMLLGHANLHFWVDWQWWAWFFAISTGIYARDWSLRSNVKLTGSL
jgi:hypothetical protein